MKYYLLFISFALLSCTHQRKAEKETVNSSTDTVDILQDTVKISVDTIQVLKDTVEVSKNEFMDNLFSSVWKKTDLKLYWLRLMKIANKKFGFVSLSDNYPLSDHPDSLAIPDLEDMKKEDLRYFRLNSKYRKRFLSKTKVSETDTVFIYNYSVDVLLSFPVKNLNVAARLDMYKDIDDYPFDQFDYMIGFEIDNRLLTDFKDQYYDNVLVYVGKENPFVRGQMKPIVWKKIDSNDFPLAKSDLKSKIDMLYYITARGNTYLYESTEFLYFLQDLLHEKGSDLRGRHLLIIDKKDRKVIVEDAFGFGEGNMPTPLNFGLDNDDYEGSPNQWTGKLFRNKAPVVFGFDSDAYFCPHITLIDTTNGYVPINCDNRH